MSESKRGCGYRKIGALYLVCRAGLTLVCDGLPMPLDPCECCGFEPPFSRNLQKLHPQYVRVAEIKKHKIAQFSRTAYQTGCTCPLNCPICSTIHDFLEHQPFGLMFVGKKDYTPSSFIREAELMGVSKRIPMIPSWLTLGETWILLAHNKVPKGVTLGDLKGNGILMKEPEYHRAVFYAFKPERIEMPVFKGEITSEEILLLEKKGITPVLLDPTPENRKRHGRAKNRKVLLALLKDTQEEES